MIHLLLLLALLAGGQVSAAMTMPMPQGDTPAAAETSDTHCKACTAADPASGPCEMLCVALPGVLPGAMDLAEAGSRADWTWPPRSGPTHAISPEPSPPRA